MSAVLERLADALRAEAGPLAEVLRPAPQGDTTLGRLAASGPVAAGRQAELELVVEAVREGYLLHYGRSRLIAGADADLALLAGDRLYALGLARVADAGDLASVVELSDVIALAAAAQAGQDPELAEAVWQAGAVAVGWGGVPAHARAKAAARERVPGAAAELRAVARQLAGDLAP